jgi:head-tail adaptor
VPALDSTQIITGLFRRRVVLQSPSGVTDADTNADTDAGITWTEFATVWCSINPLTGTAVGAPSQTLQGVVTYLVAMRWMPGVVNGMVVYEASTGLALDVLAVLDILDAHKLLHLECVNRIYPPV